MLGGLIKTEGSLVNFEIMFGFLCTYSGDEIYPGEIVLLTLSVWEKIHYGRTVITTHRSFRGSKSASLRTLCGQRKSLRRHGKVWALGKTEPFSQRRLKTVR